MDLLAEAEESLLPVLLHPEIDPRLHAGRERRPGDETRGFCLPFAGVTEHLLVHPEIALRHSFEQSTYRLLACCGLAGWPF